MSGLPYSTIEQHLSTSCTLENRLLFIILFCLQSVYKLAGERLYATYFGGDEKQGLKPDEEARQIW